LIVFQAVFSHGHDQWSRENLGHFLQMFLQL
jgi:hypothetical protein